MLPEGLGTVLLSITALAPFSASIIFLGWGIDIYHHLSFSQKQPKSLVLRTFLWSRGILDLLSSGKAVPHLLYWTKFSEQNIAHLKVTRVSWLRKRCMLLALNWYLHALAHYQPLPQYRQDPRFPNKQGFWSVFLFSSLTPVRQKDFSDCQRQFIHSFRKEAWEQTAALDPVPYVPLSRLELIYSGCWGLIPPSPFFHVTSDGGRWQWHFERQVALLQQQVD